MFKPVSTFLIISPQPWDGIRVSKHNYARELAKKGHKVFFLNPPDATGERGTISLQASDIDGISVVNYTPWFPYNIKFRFRGLFNLCMHRQAHLIQRAIKTPIDIIWDFDNAYQFSNMRWFNAEHYILHLVDQISDGLKVSNKKADLTLSVDPSFLERINVKDGHVIPHGLNTEFSAKAQAIVSEDSLPKTLTRKPNKKGDVRVGYIGNLEQVGLDWNALEATVLENPNVDFTFIGPSHLNTSKASHSLIPTTLSHNCPNADFIGRKTPADIIALSDNIDIWLLCYDAKKTVNGLLNSHKMLEYMATGRTIISSQIAAYKGNNLVIMNGRASNETYPDLFKQALPNLKNSNHIDMQKRRAAFALDFSYEKNIEKIATLLSEHTHS